MTNVSNDAPHEPCRVCGGSLRPAFQCTVLGNIQATYCVCTNCHSLIVPAPHWLNQSYAVELRPNPDFGMLRRALFVHRSLRRMRFVGLFPKRCRTLDYGSGTGLLVRLLLDQGYDAWGYDPLATPIAAEDRVVTRLPPGPFDLITAIEVIEHLCDPVEALQRLRALLAPRGVMLLSTELFDRAKHDASWHYLTPEHGQHITMLSREGLHEAAARAGLRWVGSLPLDAPDPHRPGVLRPLDFLHLLVRREQPLSAWKLWRLRTRHQRGERRALRDRYV
jgi:SAM-dependent methyltransferase